MTEPRETTEPHEKLTTEQLANAAATQTGELRSFESGAPDDGLKAAKPQPLVAEDQAADLRRGWDEIQASFVDEPRAAVRNADELVADVMARLAGMFSDERSRLEAQWGRGDYVSTEDLRVALQRYRAFFDRLLAV